MILVVEGLDGCGKTSVVAQLAELLAQRQQQYEVAKLAFPNRESPTGRVIDGYLRDSRQFKGMDAYVHQALQVVNRLEVLPELTRGDRLNVLSRYTPSALVYGALDDLNPEWLTRVTGALPAPDLCVLLACEPRVAFRRMQERGVTADQYERRGIEWFAEAARLYDSIWARAAMPSSQHDEAGTVWLRLATDDPPEVLAERLAQLILSIFSCSCGRLHNSLRTPCQEEADEEE